MTLIERRRALMAAAKDAGIMYQKLNWAFSGGNLNTMIPLCETDIDFSIAYDVTITTNPTSGNGSKYRLLRIIDAAGTNYALSVHKQESNATVLISRFMDKAVAIGSPYVGRKRFVITHAKGSNSATIRFRKDSGAVTEATAQTTNFIPTNKYLTLGQSSGENQLPSGTLNNLTVYNRVLSTAEINAFLGV